MLQINHKYPATLKSAGLSEDKNGQAYPTMSFEVADDTGAKHTVYWNGSLKSAASQAMAAKALIQAGFQYEDFNMLKDGVNMTTFAPADINVELEYTQDASGKATDKLRVKWVNARSAKQFSGAVAKAESAFQAAKAKLGIKSGPKKPTTPEAAPF